MMPTRIVPRAPRASLVFAVLGAVRDVGSPPFRQVLLKTLALTIVGLALLGTGLGKLIGGFVVLPHVVWLATAVHVLTYVLIFVVLTFCVTPVSFAVASLFFDRLADAIEHELGAGVRTGRPLSFAQAMWVGCEFALLSLLINGVALLASYLPGVNAIIFFAANAYLLGRGFFEMAALRHGTRESVRLLRRSYASRIFLAGCCCAVVATIPLVNLLTPLFATALLVRVSWPLVETD